MANSYYTHGSYPTTRQAGSSSLMRTELEAIEAGFDKLIDPATHANQVVTINGAGTAMVGSANLSFSGTTLTLNGTLAGTGLVVQSPIISNGDINTPDIDGGTMDATVLTGCTINNPILSLSPPLSVANGGTGAASAGAALAALGALAASGGTLTGGIVDSSTLTGCNIDGGSWNIATVTGGLSVTGDVYIGSSLFTSAVYRGSTAWGPSSVVNGATMTTTITVTGASVGDFVEVTTAVDLSAGFIMLTPQVLTSNTVKLTLLNATGITAAPASGAYYALVKKRT